MSPVNALLQAVHARLTGDAGLQALAGGGIHDRRLGRIDMPYLVIGSVETADFSTGSEDGLEITLVLEAWSAISRREAEMTADAVRGLMHEAELELEAAELVSLRHRRTLSRREAKTALFVAEMRFRAVVEWGE
ncbi:DUF3168 domain-containing protein [Rhizobium sp. RU36D]|uniref:DUF3168 domain-containing protein n=1 Tax=Rhizobium sp. RU36D TaxID=1907415 RepID=UPI0009D829CE|nr:DUF3168 domain-containing protein [Rhizobium sp. RU36D]SMD10840.1 Protein of unknown function [Rhizobium sp. RU36D]